jgi:hypothetical protein
VGDILPVFLGKLEVSMFKYPAIELLRLEYAIRCLQQTCDYCLVILGMFRVCRFFIANYMHSFNFIPGVFLSITYSTYLLKPRILIPGCLLAPQPLVKEEMSHLPLLVDHSS